MIDPIAAEPIWKLRRRAIRVHRDFYEALHDYEEENPNTDPNLVLAVAAVHSHLEDIRTPPTVIEPEYYLALSVLLLDRVRLDLPSELLFVLDIAQIAVRDWLKWERTS